MAATAPIIVKKQRASAPAAAIVPPRVPKAPKLQEPLTAAQPDCTPTTAPMQAAATSPAGAPTHDAPLGFMRASQLPDATPPPSAAVCAVDHALMTLSSGDGSGHALDSLTYSPVTDRLTRDARGSDAAAPAPRASLCAANDAHLAPPPAPTQHASGAACEGRASAAAAALAAAAEAVVKAGRASGKASKGGAAALGKPPSGRASGKPPSGKASGKKSGKAKASGTAAPQGAAAQELITPAMPATFKVVIATAAAAPMPARRVAAYRPPAFVRGKCLFLNTRALLLYNETPRLSSWPTLPCMHACMTAQTIRETWLCLLYARTQAPRPAVSPTALHPHPHSPHPSHAPTAAAVTTRPTTTTPPLMTTLVTALAVDHVIAGTGRATAVQVVGPVGAAVVVGVTVVAVTVAVLVALRRTRMQRKKRKLHRPPLSVRSCSTGCRVCRASGGLAMGSCHLAW